MKRFLAAHRKLIAVVVAFAFFAQCVAPASAKSPVKLQKWSGSIDFADERPSTFELSGTASHLGKFTAAGEVTFEPGEEEGTLVGTGVVVFEAANGDLLVGEVEWEISGEGGDFRESAIHFAWRNSVTFSDGTVVSNTGRFVNDRPPGLVVIAIIAILIGLLVPAIQK